MAMRDKERKKSPLEQELTKYLEAKKQQAAKKQEKEIEKQVGQREDITRYKGSESLQYEY